MRLGWPGLAVCLLLAASLARLGQADTNIQVQRALQVCCTHAALSLADSDLRAQCQVLLSGNAQSDWGAPFANTLLSLVSETLQVPCGNVSAHTIPNGMLPPPPPTARRKLLGAQPDITLQLGVMASDADRASVLTTLASLASNPAPAVVRDQPDALAMPQQPAMLHHCG